jgi:hypothetical protein
MLFAEWLTNVSGKIFWEACMRTIYSLDAETTIFVRIDRAGQQPVYPIAWHPEPNSRARQYNDGPDAQRRRANFG